jgi:transcriptional regulator with GAF, ATPase, and Fis domain
MPGAWPELGPPQSHHGEQPEQSNFSQLHRGVHRDQELDVWRGIRELRNVLERALLLSPGPVEHILRTLESCDWRIRGVGNAAARLKLNPNTLHSRMKKLGIRRPAQGRHRAGSV